jgi:hypothetical protein
MEHAERDRLAMPVRIGRIDLFGPHPPAGDRVACVARIRRFDATSVVADVALDRDGVPWVRIEGWEDRRFDSDPKVWAVLRYPEENVLVTDLGHGAGLLRTPWRAVASRDLMARRYLGERGRAEMAAKGPRRQEEWLLGRIAAVDCARLQLQGRGHGRIFPIEIDVEGDPAEGIMLRGPLAQGLHAAVAARDGLAVARVTEGRRPGVALERVEPGDDEGDLRRRAARSAAAQALGAAPEGLEARAVEGERVLVGDLAVETRREEGHVVAWTIG